MSDTLSFLKISRLRQLFSRVFLKIGREFLWVGLGQGIAVLGGAVGVRLLTGALDPTSYGELALATTGVTLTQQVASGPLANAFLRFFSPAQERNQLGAYLRGVWGLLRQVTVGLLAVVGLLSLGLLGLGYTKWLALVLSAFLFSLLSSYSSAFNSIQNAARHRVIVAWHQGLGQWIRFLAAVGLITFLGSSSSVAMLGYALSSMIVLCSQSFFFYRKILRKVSHFIEANGDEVESWIREMRSYAWPFATWGLFTWARSSSDRWALQVFGMSSDVGLYAALFQVGYYPIMLLSGLVVNLVSPILFGRVGDGSDQARLNRTRRLNTLLVLGSVLLTMLGTMLALLLHTQIFSLLVAPKYRVISPLLPWMVLSSGLFASSQNAVISIKAGLQTRKMIAPKIATALLAVLLSFAGAYCCGLRGVVLSNVAFSVTHFLWIYLLQNTSLSDMA